MPTLVKTKQASSADLSDAEKCNFPVSDQLDYSSKEDSDNHWKLIVDKANDDCQGNAAFAKGKTVFVFKEHVKVIEPRSCVVAGSVANIRSGPSTDSTVLGTAQQNEEIQVEGLEGEWYVTLFNGSRAYMNNSVFKEPCVL